MAGRIDETREFKPLRIAILTISDTRTLDDDRSGDRLITHLEEAGHTLATRAIVKDTITSIQAVVTDWVDSNDVDVIITTGGTGITGRDVTPEALRPLFDVEIPGFGELFRQLSYELIGTSTIQSRALAGRTKATLIFALPGSPSACSDGWRWILATQLDYRYRPCNFAELLPRFLEK